MSAGVSGAAADRDGVEPGSRQDRSAAGALDQALWRDLVAGADERSFAEAWLGLLCRTVRDGTGAVLLLGDVAAPPRVTASWPSGLGVAAELTEIALGAIQNDRGLAKAALRPSPTRLAFPLRLDGKPAGAVAIEIASSDEAAVRAAMRQLQWAAAWPRERWLAARQATREAAASRTALALDLIAAIIDQPGAIAACRLAATELALALHCERVAIGFVHRGSVRLAAISHSAAFGRQMQLSRFLSEAMDEAIDQGAIVVWPPVDDSILISSAHQRLASLHGGGIALTVPMLCAETAVGAVTFERPAGQPFNQSEIELAELVVSVLAPALAEKRANDRPLAVKAVEAASHQILRLIRPGHAGIKLALAAAVALGVAALVVRTEDRIHASAELEGKVQRAIVAPFDGFVAQADHKAGDTVRTSDLLAAMDDRDLVLERLRWSTERQAHLVEYDAALAAGKRADAARLQAQIDEATAQVGLADAELGRARLLAPFPGLIVSGDLSQSIGAPVKRGDVLFELARRGDYTVALKIDESEVAEIRPGEHGKLIISSLPGLKLPIVVTRVAPIAVAQDGRMMFHAEADLMLHSERLRPGMDGLAKIDAGRARLVWIWSRPFLHWLRLTTWSILP